MTIGVNPAFLRDATSAVSGDRLELQVIDPERALGVRSATDPAFRAYLMPVRLKN
jgi:DNA polymerase III sliding clamp (beta) subunit (PCNA family)